MFSGVGLVSAGETGHTVIRYQLYFFVWMNSNSVHGGGTRHVSLEETPSEVVLDYSQLQSKRVTYFFPKPGKDLSSTSSRMCLVCHEDHRELLTLPRH